MCTSQLKSSSSSSSVDGHNGNELRAKMQHFGSKVWKLYAVNSFLLNVLFVIFLAYLAPAVGLALAPAITASRVAVAIIFLLSGLSLKTSELVNALKNVKFNTFVQCFNMGVVTISAFGVAKFLSWLNALNDDLADGIIICGALPMTVNMVIVLTKSANGDEAAAIFNSAFGSLLGVFVTPAWVVVLVGRSGSNNFAGVIRNLTERVLVPLFFGQICQYVLPSLVAWAKRHKPALKRLQESCLVFIVYCVFCRRFRDSPRKNTDQENTTALDIIVVIIVQTTLLSIMMVLAWLSLALAFPTHRKLRVMGLFGCTHKTVAAGVPLIDAIYSNDPARSLYILPLLVWHPAQLVLGSAISSRLANWVNSESSSSARESGSLVEEPPCERIQEDGLALSSSDHGTGCDPDKPHLAVESLPDANPPAEHDNPVSSKLPPSDDNA